ncbi:MAG: glycosyltransferase family 2 protein [Muribaculaceae bacterium]|nr:glycosyltransferase family 2 protein [Muribaculaceae bacterium]MDE7457706.1 glycosyltransferase family 2 protein [Muribaculaceae bacterium]
MIRLAIVCPCYNEEAVIENSAEQLRGLIARLSAEGKITADSYVLLVNDGSRDRTWQLIKKLHESDATHFKGLDLAHNAGHQKAILAGMLTAVETADAVVTIDVDLQDDIEAIGKMVDAYEQGYDVVYGVKVSRKADPAMKRLTAVAFYKLQRKLGVETVYNHADFRFMSRRVVEELARYEERNLFLRGIIPLIGFRSTTVDDVIGERQAGESKYTVSKMLTLALNGITSFSVKPIYSILSTGLVFVFVAIGIGLYVMWSLFTGTAEHGWASLMLSIWFVGGMILLAIGVVGLYVGRIFIEVKRRPMYHISEKLM